MALLKSIKDTKKLTKDEITEGILERLQKYTMDAHQIFEGNNPSFQTNLEKIEAIGTIIHRFCGASDILRNVIGMDVRLDDGTEFSQSLVSHLHYYEKMLIIRAGRGASVKQNT